MTTPDPLTHGFRAALFDGTLPPGVTATDPDEAPRRFSIYRNKVTHSLSRALARRFPVIERLIGTDAFAATAHEFLAQHPPRDPRLFLWGEAFPGFLETFPPLHALPYLPDTARLEWLRGQAYHAADAAPADPGLLARAAADPACITLLLHPSLRLLRSRFSVVTLWQAHQPGTAPPEGRLRIDRGENALILRDAADRVPVHALSQAEAAFLSALLQGAPLLAAAEAADGADPSPLLTLLARAGAITGLVERTPT